MTDIMRPWFWSANLFYDGQKYKFACGIITTCSTGSDLFENINSHIIEEEYKTGIKIKKTDVQIIALNRAD